MREYYNNKHPHRFIGDCWYPPIKIGEENLLGKYV